MRILSMALNVTRERSAQKMLTGFFPSKVAERGGGNVLAVCFTPFLSLRDEQNHCRRVWVLSFAIKGTNIFK